MFEEGKGTDQSEQHTDAEGDYQVLHEEAANVVTFLHPHDAHCFLDSRFFLLEHYEDKADERHDPDNQEGTRKHILQDDLVVAVA